MDTITGKKARLEYLDADYIVISPGDYVECAVTGKRIPLEVLRYWSVDRQEAYADAAASMQANKNYLEEREA